MVNRRDPVEVRQGLTLRVRNGNQWSMLEAPGRQGKTRQIKPPVHRRDEGNRTSKYQWDMDPIGMAMDHVEGFCPVRNRIKESRVSGPWVWPWATEPQGTWTSRDESGVGQGVTTGKQSDIAAQPHQLLGKPGDHPLSAAIEFRGYALRQRRYFRDAHILQI